MKNKTKFLQIHGGINSGKTKDIIQEVAEMHNSGKVEGIDISLDDVNASDFQSIAKLVSTLKSVGIKKKVAATSNISIAALALMSTTSAARRSIPEYLEIDFEIPEKDTGLNQDQLNNLFIQYAQLMKSIQNDNFSETMLIDYMRSGKKIQGKMAKSLGIVGSSRGRGKGSKTGTLVSVTPVNVPEKEAVQQNNQEKEEVTA